MNQLALTFNTPADLACPSCETSFFTDNYGIEIFAGNGNQWFSWQPCCSHSAHLVPTLGFSRFYGRTLEEVVNELAPAMNLRTTLDDGTLVGPLRIYDPTTVNDGKAASPAGWRSQIFADIRAHHRHHPPPHGHKFSVAVYNGLVKVGVAIISRPVSRIFAESNPTALEVTRVATWGHPALRRNTVSKLYAAAAKRAKTLKATLLITYTLYEESGSSLRASGFTPTFKTQGGSWNRTTRPRTDKAPITRKIRWERGLDRQARQLVSNRALSKDLFGHL